MTTANSGNGNNHDTIAQYDQEGKAIGVDNLRAMLLKLTATQSHEIQHAEECKELIRSYFTNTL